MVIHERLREEKISVHRVVTRHTILHILYYRCMRDIVVNAINVFFVSLLIENTTY